MLSVTNSFEGSIFVDQSTSNTVQVADYVSQLFPNFGPEQSSAAAAQYAGSGTNIFQAVAIMGECGCPCSDAYRPNLDLRPTAIFICPTYFLLRAFDGRAYKVGVSPPPPSHFNIFIQFFQFFQGEFAVPPAFHGQDITFYLPDFQFFSFGEDTTKNVSRRSSRMTLESLNGASPKPFNVETGAPDVRLVTKSSVLLERRE